MVTRPPGSKVWFAVICFGLLLPWTGSALTLYRIGADYSAGDPAPEGVDVVHLSWEDASAGFGGGWKVVDMDEGGLAPVLLEPDRNIALDAAGLGGGAFGAKWPVKTSHEFHGLTVDGDPTTAFEEADIKETREWPFLGVDLGGVLPINRVVFYPTTEHQDRFPEYLRLYVFGGDPSSLDNPFGSLRDFDLVAQEEDNRTSRIEVTMSTQFVHTVMLEIGDPQSPDRDFRSGSRPWQIAEFEIYGDGYAPNAFLRSRVLDLGTVTSVGRIRWSGQKDRGRQGGDSHPKRRGQRPEPLLAPHRAGHRGQLPRPPGTAADAAAVRRPAADRAGRHLPGPGQLELLVGPVRFRRQRRNSGPLPRPAPFSATGGAVRERLPRRRGAGVPGVRSDEPAGGASGGGRGFADRGGRRRGDGVRVGLPADDHRGRAGVSTASFSALQAS